MLYFLNSGGMNIEFEESNGYKVKGSTFNSASFSGKIDICFLIISNALFIYTLLLK